MATTTFTGLDSTALGGGSWGSDANFRAIANAFGDALELGGWERTTGYTSPSGGGHYDRDTATLPPSPYNATNSRYEQREKDGVFLVLEWREKPSTSYLGLTMYLASQQGMTSQVSVSFGSGAGTVLSVAYDTDYISMTWESTGGEGFLMLGLAGDSKTVVLVGGGTGFASLTYTDYCCVHKDSGLTYEEGDPDGCYVLPFGLTASPSVLNKFVSKYWIRSPGMVYVPQVAVGLQNDFTDAALVDIDIAEGTTVRYRVVNTVTDGAFLLKWV